MIYEQPCRFPTDDPDHLWFQMTGRVLSQFEATYWYAVLIGGRKRIPLIGFVLCLFFAMMPLTYTAGMPDAGNEVLIAFLVILIAVCTLCIATAWAIYHPKRHATRWYVNYVADSARHERGDRIAFFTDYVTVTSLRGVRRMKWSEVVTCVETYNGFALYDEANWIILRAQDMTATDVQFVRDYLTARLDPKVMMCRSRAMCVLAQPLPIPQNYPEATCLTSAAIAFEQTELGKREKTRRFLLLFACNTALALLVAVMFAAVFTVTPYHLVDLVIFCAAWVAGSAVVTLLFSKLFFRKNTQTLRLRFEPDGLQITVGETAVFITKDRLRLTVTDSTVRLWFINGDPFSIPLSVVEDASVLKALAGVR